MHSFRDYENVSISIEFLNKNGIYDENYRQQTLYLVQFLQLNQSVVKQELAQEEFVSIQSFDELTELITYHDDKKYPLLNLDISDLQFQGSQDTSDPFTYSQIQLTMNYNRIYQQAFENCLQVTDCQEKSITLTEIIERLASEVADQNNGTVEENFEVKQQFVQQVQSDPQLYRLMFVYLNESQESDEQEYFEYLFGRYQIIIQQLRTVSQGIVLRYAIGDEIFSQEDVYSNDNYPYFQRNNFKSQSNLISKAQNDVEFDSEYQVILQKEELCLDSQWKRPFHSLSSLFSGSGKKHSCKQKLDKVSVAQWEESIKFKELKQFQYDYESISTLKISLGQQKSVIERESMNLLQLVSSIGGFIYLTKLMISNILLSFPQVSLESELLQLTFKSDKKDLDLKVKSVRCFDNFLKSHCCCISKNGKNKEHAYSLNRDLDIVQYLNSMRQFEKLRQEFKHLDETVYILIQGTDEKSQVKNDAYQEMKSKTSHQLNNQFTTFNSNERDIIRKFQKQVKQEKVNRHQSQSQSQRKEMETLRDKLDRQINSSMNLDSQASLVKPHILKNQQQRSPVKIKTMLSKLEELAQVDKLDQEIEFKIRSQQKEQNQQLDKRKAVVNRLSLHYGQDSLRKSKNPQSVDKEETKYELNDSDINDFPYESQIFKKQGNSQRFNNSNPTNDLAQDDDVIYQPNHWYNQRKNENIIINNKNKTQPQTTKHDGDKKTILELLKGQQERDRAESELKSSSRFMVDQKSLVDAKLKKQNRIFLGKMSDISRHNPRVFNKR